MTAGPILNARPPAPPWATPRYRGMPGAAPLDPADWLWVDDAFGPQMAERDRLLREAPERVHALRPAALPAARELLDHALTALADAPGYALAPDAVTRPDGVRVALDRAAPLMTLGRLVQEDFCLLHRPEGADEHVLTGAVLCFPAGWTLAEKMDRPLTRIHAPVRSYDDAAARRVQRLFDGLRPGQGLWRVNGVLDADPALHQPLTEAERHHAPVSARQPGRYFRSERQTLLRLPETGAVAFSIHTIVMDAAALTEAERAATRA